MDRGSYSHSLSLAQPPENIWGYLPSLAQSSRLNAKRRIRVISLATWNKWPSIASRLKYNRSVLTPWSSEDSILKRLGRKHWTGWPFFSIISPFCSLKLAPMFLYCFLQLEIFTIFFLVGALESHCTPAKHHSCLPENKNRRERSGQRIKAQGGFVWQIVAGVLPV